MCSNKADACAAAIDQAIIGFPQKSRMFLRGMRLLPPRAGMTQRLDVIDNNRSFRFGIRLMHGYLHSHVHFFFLSAA